ncbi:hypothetical protein [Streptomyces microflavus]|uniref:hypothetical protein n=1 Tax=Streptomyces microflavus TaxID=1919 RepID=UPI003324D224
METNRPWAGLPGDLRAAKTLVYDPKGFVCSQPVPEGGIMVAFHASALDGVARNPALPTPLLLRLLAFDGGGDGPPRYAPQRTGLLESAVAVIPAHPNPGARVDFAMSKLAEPVQRARLVDEPSPKVRGCQPGPPEDEMAAVLNRAGVPV